MVWCVSEVPYVEEPLHLGTPGERIPAAPNKERAAAQMGHTALNSPHLGELIVENSRLHIAREQPEQIEHSDVALRGLDALSIKGTYSLITNVVLALLVLNINRGFTSLYCVCLASAVEASLPLSMHREYRRIAAPRTLYLPNYHRLPTLRLFPR